MSPQHHQHRVLTCDSSVRDQCGAKTLSICVSLNEYLATYWITFPSLHGNADFLSVWVQCYSLLMAWLTAHILHWIASVTVRLPNYSCPRDSLWWIRSVFLCLLKGLSIFSCSSASHLFFFLFYEDSVHFFWPIFLLATYWFIRRPLNIWKTQ